MADMVLFLKIVGVCVLFVLLLIFTTGGYPYIRICQKKRREKRVFGWAGAWGYVGAATSRLPWLKKKRDFQCYCCGCGRSKYRPHLLP